MQAQRTKSLRQLSCAALVLAAAPGALAEPWAWEGSTSLSTSVIDRGETLATLNNETSFTVSRAAPVGEIYGGLYRISPIGDDASAFDEEVDYTIGFAFEQNGIAFDASANYLTFPGSAADESLELAGEVSFDHTLAPAVAAFYDVTLDVYGVEASIAPSYEAGAWTVTGILRAGSVLSGDGDYSYGGIEGTIARALGDAFTLEGFARFEAADEANFASDIQNDGTFDPRTNGTTLGIRLTVQG